MGIQLSLAQAKRHAAPPALGRPALAQGDAARAAAPRRPRRQALPRPRPPLRRPRRRGARPRVPRDRHRQGPAQPVAAQALRPRPAQAPRVRARRAAALAGAPLQPLRPRGGQPPRPRPLRAGRPRRRPGRLHRRLPARSATTSARTQRSSRTASRSSRKSSTGATSGSPTSSTSGRRSCASPSTASSGTASASARSACRRRSPSPPPDVRGSGRIELAARLRHLDAWSHLRDEQIFQLTEAVAEEEHEKGQQIFAEGTPGADLYVLEKGEITIQRATPYGTYPARAAQAGRPVRGSELPDADRAQRRRGGVAALPAAAAGRAPARRGDPPRPRARRADLLELLAQPRLQAALHQRAAAHVLQRGRACPRTCCASSSSAPRAAARLPVDSETKMRLFREQGLSQPRADGARHLLARTHLPRWRR